MKMDTPNMTTDFPDYLMPIMTTDYPDYLTPDSSETVSQPCNTIRLNEFTTTFLPTFYYIIFTASIIGNGLVLLVVFKFEKLNTVTNIFLLNLVASNLVFTLTLPFQAVHHVGQWVFGVVLCKLVTCADSLGFYSSILFLTLMTFDRYLAVVHCVVANKKRRSCYAAALSAVVWALSLLASLEPLIFYTVERYPMEGDVCKDSTDGQWKHYSLYKQFVLFFLFPLTVFIFCYSRIIRTVLAMRMVGKHRTVRLIFVIVLMFFIFWSPYNIVDMIKEHRQCSERLEYAAYITGNIARFYFCINPLFYTFLGKKFQNHVRGALASRVSCLTSRISVHSSSRSLA